MSTEQSPEVQAVEDALAELDVADQACARAWDATRQVPVEAFVAYADAYEKYASAINLLPGREFNTYVPF